MAFAVGTWALPSATVKVRVKKNISDPHLDFLSAMASDDDRIRGLQLGADDYLVKPFNLMELLERVKAVLRRTAPLRQDTLELNGREIDLPNRIIRHQQKEYSMSQFEIRILELLLSRPGQIISRATILEQV